MNSPKFKPFGTGPRPPTEVGGVTSAHPDRKVDRHRLVVKVEAPCPNCGSKKGVSFVDGPDKKAYLECKACGHQYPLLPILERAGLGNAINYYDLHQHEAFSSAVGRLAALSGLIDRQLCTLASLVLRSPIWHAHTAFFAIVNAGARIDMLRSAATHMVGQKQFGAELVLILDDARDLATKRNKYIHAAWGIGADRKIVYMLENQWSPSKAMFRKVEIDEIHDVLKSISEFRDRFSDFLLRYGERYPVWTFGQVDEVVPDALRDMRR